MQDTFFCFAIIILTRALAIMASLIRNSGRDVLFLISSVDDCNEERGDNCLASLGCFSNEKIPFSLDCMILFAFFSHVSTVYTVICLYSVLYLSSSSLAYRVNQFVINNVWFGTDFYCRCLRGMNGLKSEPKTLVLNVDTAVLRPLSSSFTFRR